MSTSPSRFAIRCDSFWVIPAPVCACEELLATPFSWATSVACVLEFGWGPLVVVVGVSHCIARISLCVASCFSVFFTASSVSNPPTTQDVIVSLSSHVAESPMCSMIESMILSLISPSVDVILMDNFS